MPAPAPLVPPTVDVPHLHDAVLGWFAVHARDLPWRSPDCSPWGVLVSEIMLQQTPVVRVLPRWREWLERWPTPADLAAAPTADVLTAWDRLGYPRRALRLQEAARAVVERHDGRVPADPAALRALPGIGEYTAAAVASFAFGIPETHDPVGAVTLGHPADGGAAGSPARRTRRPLDEVVHRGRWSIQYR